MDQKKYSEPLFDFVIQDKSNKVFFTASNAPGEPNFATGINNMTIGSHNWN